MATGVPEHTVNHMRVMTELTKQGRYDRMTDDLFKLTGQTADRAPLGKSFETVAYQTRD